MKRYGILLTLLVWAMAWSQLQAQDGERTTYVQAANPATGYKGMMVRWSHPDIVGSPSLNIYRQLEGASDWQRVNEKPFAFGQVAITADERKANSELDALTEIAAKLKSGVEQAGMMKGFVLYRSITLPKFGQHLGILFNDSTAEAGKRYRYEVREVKGQNEKAYSAASGYATVGKYAPASGPDGIRYEAGDQIAKMTWTPDENFVSFNVYVTTTKGAAKTLLNQDPIMQTKTVNEAGAMVFPEWFFVKDKLTNGTTYYFEISRIDLFGNESLHSAPFEVTPKDMKPPKEPKGLELTHKGSEVTLTWKADAEADLAGFNIYRASVNRDTALQLLTKRPIGAAERKFADRVPDLNVVYIYVVEAADQSDNRSRSKIAYIQVYDLEAPKMPTNFTAKADTGVVYLKWSANTEKDLKGYKVYRGLEGSPEDKYVCLTAKAWMGTSYTDTLPKRARNKFSYRISAVDTIFNESPKTAVVAAQMPDIVPPQAPFLTGINAEGRTITLTWMPNLENDLMGYMVERALHDADTAKWTRVTPNPLAKTAMNFVDKTALPGVKYYYRLQAMDVSKNPSKRSNVYMGFVADVKMATAPQALAGQVEANKKAVVLKWEIEKSDELSGCMVYRKEGNADFLPISGLLQTTQFQDPIPGKGKTYYYEVRAYDKRGNAAKSNEVPVNIPQDPTK